MSRQYRTVVKWNGREVTNPLGRFLVISVMVVTVPILLTISLIFLLLVTLPLALLLDVPLKLMGRQGCLRDNAIVLDGDSFRKA